MKKINFNIKLDNVKKFDELEFSKKYPDLYEEHLIDLSEADFMEIVKSWISNMLIRSINDIKVDERGNAKATKSATVDIQCKYARVIEALQKHKDGWVKMEDADFEFMMNNWRKAEIPLQERVALIISKINSSLEEAERYRGNPE